jgi:hypothetical protein
LSTRTDADDTDPDNPFTLGKTGVISNTLRWAAGNNLGQRFGGGPPAFSERSFVERDIFMSASFPVDSSSLVSSMEFEATVGETLEIRADLFTLAMVGGGAGSSEGSVGSTQNAFFGSLESSVVDPANRGLQIEFEILPESDNLPPVANAGADRAVGVGSPVKPTPVGESGRRSDRAARQPGQPGWFR